MKRINFAVLLVLAALLLAACDSSAEDPLQSAVTRAAAELGQEAAQAPETPAAAAPSEAPPPSEPAIATEPAETAAATEPASEPAAAETGAVRVEADGSGEFAGLAEAAAALAPGSTIELGAGDFELAETLVVDKPLTIRGAGMEATRIISTAGTAVLSFEGEGVLVVSDVSLVSAAAADSGDVIYVRGGALEIANCRIQGAKQATDGDFGAGIFAENDALVTVSGCEIAGNQGVGIEAFGETVITVEDSSVSGNGAGLLFDSSSSGTIRNNVISQNEDGGILLFGHSAYEIDENTISGNLDIGVQYRLTGGSAGAAQGNELLDNHLQDTGTDILVVGEFAPELRGNSCSAETPPSDAQTGVVVDQSGIVLLSEGVSVPVELINGENDCAFTVCAVIAGESGQDIQCFGT